MSVLDTTRFANVDLDIYSKSDLQPLVDSFGEDVINLWTGRVKRTYETHLELGRWRRNQTPTSIILGFCKLVEALPPAKRKIWDAAKSRSFDIGIEAPGRGSYYWSAVSSGAVRAAAEAGAQIAITVYGPMKTVKRPHKKAKSASSK
ncbi:MAG: hypothetical protein WAM85_21445 [Terracidiphilus sp.]